MNKYFSFSAITIKNNDGSMIPKLLPSLLFYCFVIILLAGCRQEDRVMKEFMVFYEKFHQDTAYQMEHIVFPLEGIPAGGDSLMLAGEKFHWKREDWTPHRPFNFENTEFTREFIRYSDDLIEEKIVHNTGSYGMLRRFTNFGGEWYLIYYVASNRLKPKPEINIEGGF